MAKLELLRALNGHHPEMIARIIGTWGTRQLPVYLNELLLDSGQQPDGADGGLAETLLRLRQAHDEEFPQHAVALNGTIPEKLRENGSFKAIDARFPHIGRHLGAYWGQAKFSEYVNDLLNNTRNGQRHGFPEEVALALWKLMQQHDREYPEFQVRLVDIWALNDSQ